MEIQEMAVPDAYRIRPRKLTDPRGSFFESFKHGELARVTGHVFTPAQTNFSVSHRDTLRGLHGVTIPPGQAKLVACVRGAVLDLVVDLRVGSPTFGACDTNVLDADEGTAVYIAEGLAHGFVALTDDACMNYLCSTEYVPGTQFDINPFDRELDLPWRLERDPLVSEKDAGAPSLAEAVAAGTLPDYDECLAYYARLRGGESGSSRPAAPLPTVAA